MKKRRRAPERNLSFTPSSVSQQKRRRTTHTRKANGGERERERECGREKAGRAGQVDILRRAGQGR